MTRLLKGENMDVVDAIQERRAYRSLAPLEISSSLIQELSESVSLAPSCFNNQPWRFVFVSDPAVLMEMHRALSEGNRWARSASLIIAVFSRKEDDCIIRDRHYHQFDTGMGVGFLLLRATELGLVAHPIAGFSPKKTREILNIPDAYDVITLIMVGKHASDISPLLNDKQVAAEHHRPQRMPWHAFVHLDRFRQED
jgi:nitroreductase